MKNYIFICLSIFVFISCNKKQNQTWYSGMQIIDQMGNMVKWVGTPDNDWLINKYTFTPKMFAMLPVDSLNANWFSTTVGTVYVSPGTNPIAFDTPYIYYSFYAFSTKKCTLNYTLTDENNSIITSNNTTITDSQLISPIIKIPSTMVSTGKVYRIYYCFSAYNNPYFAYGWGDIGICNKSVSGVAEECF